MDSFAKALNVSYGVKLDNFKYDFNIKQPKLAELSKEI